MPSLPLLIYCSRLTRSEYRQLLDLSLTQPGVMDFALVDQAMRESVTRRMELAQEFLAFGESLQPASGVSSDIAARNAVSRAYYAVHHALHALLLFEERGDIDGHRDAIEAMCALIKRNPAVRAKLGELSSFRAQALDLLTQRHLADYHPFGASVPDEMPGDFPALAVDALRFARHVLEKSQEYITQKEAGNIP